MSSARLLLSAAALCAAVLGGCGSSDKSGQAGAQPLSVRESIDVNVTATVKAVNPVTRAMTVQDESGHELSFTVDPAVKRLAEIRAGDRVSARCRATLLAELRPPTPDESAHPIAAVEVAGRAPDSQAPAGGIGTAVRVVTTVAAIDVPNMLVTLRGPLGDTALVRARKEENIKKLKLGDTIVITYTEALALSVEKQ